MRRGILAMVGLLTAPVLIAQEPSAPAPSTPLDLAVGATVSSEARAGSAIVHTQVLDKSYTDAPARAVRYVEARRGPAVVRACVRDLRKGAG